MKEVKTRVKLLAITPSPEALIEEAGRTCYLSLDKITKESKKGFIYRCLKSGHLSIFEHASASFRILGASRAFTHQLVRHRLASFSQQSQRYVDEKNFNYITPLEISANPEAAKIYKNFLSLSRETYAELRNLGIKKENARFILPNALESQIVFSANFRELRTILALRLEKAAQWEIREVCLQMLKILQKKAPNVFSDFIINEKEKTAKSNLI